MNINPIQNKIILQIGLDNGETVVIEEKELKKIIGKNKSKKVVIKPYMPVLCPNCGKEFSISLGDGYYNIPKSNITNYCSNCGQKLDWGEEE